MKCTCATKTPSFGRTTPRVLVDFVLQDAYCQFVLQNDPAFPNGSMVPYDQCHHISFCSTTLLSPIVICHSAFVLEYVCVTNTTLLYSTTPPMSVDFALQYDPPPICLVE
jgi:hypothetical protein